MIDMKKQTKKDAVPRFGDAAQALVEQGYRPVPVHWGRKNPSVTHDWTDYEFKPKDIAGALSYKKHGTGILCGEVVAVDIDIRNQKVVAEIESLAEKMLGPAPRRIGLAPKVLRIYRTDAPFAKITSDEVVLSDDDIKAPGYKRHRVEILGSGQQFVCFNQHPDTGRPYTWNGCGDPLTVPVSKLAAVTESRMREFVNEATKVLKKHARDASNGMAAELEKDAKEQARQFEKSDDKEARDPDECRAALRAIPNDDLDYDAYIRIGCAVANALGAAGEADWHEWASKSAKYNKSSSDKDWCGFMKLRREGRLKAGAGTIFREAEAHGWRRPLSLIQRIPADWFTSPPPPQEWLVDRLIPMGCVTAGLAEGGTGKSFTMLQLAEATTHGSKKWWTTEERELRRGGVVYVAAEDTLDVIRRRLFAIRMRWISRMSKTLKGKALNDAIEARDTETRKHLHFAPIVGKDIHLIDTTTGEVRQGPGVDRLIENLRTVDDLVLMVLDPLSRLHGGDENSNSVSTALINAAERIAQEFGCAVIVLHHVSKQAASDKNASAHAGRGGSALGDGARSVLRFLPVEPREIDNKLKLLRQGEPIGMGEVADGNVIRIVHAKNSYGPRQKDIFLLRDRETGELLNLKAVADERDQYTVMLGKLKAWFVLNPGVVTKDTFRDATARRKEAFGICSKAGWLEFFDAAVTKGDLIEDPDYRGKNSDAKGYKFDDTRHAR